MSIFVSGVSDEVRVLSRVVLGGNGELLCDLWLLYGVWATVHKL